ncbi:hypothetical protein HWV62_22369 [Athelia sp. TMB]|nr:hypothetical protein HWV62_22369 [Athelia sp. TMB]
MNHRYSLPADDDEVKASIATQNPSAPLVVQWLFAGKNYVGPTKEVLLNAQRHKSPRLLDIGTGGGQWAIDMADEFRDVEVIGADLAPIQPRFELCDFDLGKIPYPSRHFDLVHARIKDYPRFLREVARILRVDATSSQRPGGLLLVIEADTIPVINGNLAADVARSGQYTNVAGWAKLWNAYRTCLKSKGIDLNIPRNMRRLLNSTGAFTKVVTRSTDVPIGFWPQDDTELTIGQLAWMEHDLLLPAMEPILREQCYKSDSEVKLLIENAQRDLYYPKDRLATRLHVIHAMKKTA